MIRKITFLARCVLLSSLLVAVFCMVPQVLAAEDCDKISCTKDEENSDQYQSCVNSKKSCLEEKIAEAQSQKITLNNTLSIIAGKIKLQELQISQVQGEINTLEREITGLAERIGGLNVSLDRLSTMLVERIKEQYKQSRTTPFNDLLEANSFGQVVNRMQYLSEASGQTATGMQRAEMQRIIYDQQKELKEKKQAEVEEKKRQLVKEKSIVDQQKAEQQALLKVTNNNEARYQQLLAEAQAQIDSFKKFVSVSGGSIISPDGLGTGYDGSYFSQRDSRWASTAIGNSGENIYNVGCLITSISMVLKSKGVDINPGIIGSNTSYFFDDTAYMLSRSDISLPGGKKGQSISKNSINSQLEKGNSVIVGVYAGFYGTHFVVLKKKDGDNWIMYDPVYGPDLKFTSKYSVSSIFSAEIIQ